VVLDEPGARLAACVLGVIVLLKDVMRVGVGQKPDCRGAHVIPQDFDVD